MPTAALWPENKVCPCGSGLKFVDCCQLCLTEQRPALSALALMRSRYTAHVLADWRYIARSQRLQGQRSAATGPDSRAEEIQWLRLEIVAVEASLLGREDRARVTFKAFYRVSAQGLEQVLHEKSRFRRLQGRWYYVGGQVMSG